MIIPESSILQTNRYCIITIKNQYSLTKVTQVPRKQKHILYSDLFIANTWGHNNVNAKEIFWKQK